MKDLIIVGAGNAAREYLQFAKDINNASLTWNIKGFIADFGGDIENLTYGEYKILGNIVDWQPSENEVFVCSISDPKGKQKVIKSLLNRGAKFVNLIHPLAKIDDYVQCGQGLIMYPNSTIGVNSIVGDFVTVSGSIAHDCVIGNFVTLSGDASLSGGVSVGDASFLGAKSIVAPGIKIGEESFICIGSVVIRNVRDKTRVFGNPAKRIDF